MDVPLAEAEVAAMNRRFEGAAPREVLAWALGEIDRVAIASAFQAEGTCVLHMASELRPGVPVLFLDTGFHFDETHAFRTALAERLDLRVVELRGRYTPETQAEAHGDRLYERDPDLCCRLNKVEPFAEALHHYDGWITALRRDSSPSRAAVPILEQYDLETGRPMLKVNPVANWNRADVWRYLDDHDLPRNPLYDLGYLQIGCAPCSRLSLGGEHEREGRWDGSQKVECGLHASPGPSR